jgi:hypothetical protein
MRRPVLVVTALVLLAGAVAAYSYYAGRADRFVLRWSDRFKRVGSLEEAKRLEGVEPVFVHAFASSEWFIATCQHSCCSGDGFDATVIRDSTGAIYADTTHTFCGIEGMGSELRDASGNSLREFYSHLTILKLRKL